jgi:hypothetical protein
MSGSVIATPQNLAELITMIARYRAVIGRAKGDILGAGANAVEHVSHAYDYASDAGAAGDMETSAKAGAMHRHVIALSGLLDQMYVVLGQMKAEVAKSVQAIDDADARRKTARGKLQV